MCRSRLSRLIINRCTPGFTTALRSLYKGQHTRQLVFKMTNICSVCRKEFSTSSNRIRHERMFHHKKVYEDSEVSEEENEEESENSEEGSEEGSDMEDEENEIDVWPDVIKHAASKMEIENYEDVVREPYLSEFVDLMKTYVEEKRTFVRAIQDDSVYRTIYEEFEACEDSDGIPAEETNAAIDLAWQNKRFRLRTIIKENIHVVEAMQKLKDSDEDSI